MLTPFASIIRIALRLLLSSVAMFCIGPRAIAFSRCNVDRVLYLPSGWHQYIDPVDSGDQGCVSHVISLSGIVTGLFFPRE